MSQTIHQLLYEYILKNQPNKQSPPKELTVDRVFDVFLSKIQEQHQEKSIFTQQFFKVVLRKIAQIIMNAVYKHQLPFVKLEQLVTVVGVVQHITYSISFDLPKPLTQKLTKYIHSLIVLESMETMRTLFQDSRNSHVLSNYYHQVYKSAYLCRAERISSVYGLKLTSTELPLLLLKNLVEQKEGNLQKYQSCVTSQWITLSLIYLTLSVKTDMYKQKPVLARILQRYNELPCQHECQRQINGDQLCDFYNSVILGVITKLDEKEFQSFIDEIKIDIDMIAEYVVSPIHNQNNTVLDNIIFSSSWDP